MTVSHAAVVGAWFVKGDYGARATVANTTEWGTGRYTSLELIQDALNLKDATVYDLDSQTKNSVVNATETEAARDKLEKIKDGSKRGSGRTTTGASGFAASTTTSSIPCACASSTALT